MVAAGNILGDYLDDVTVDDHTGQVDAVVTESAAEHIADDSLGGEAQAYQNLAQVLLARLLLGERDADLVLADDALADQGLADAADLDRRLDIDGWRIDGH
jgi:hypothetical protein